MEELGLKPEEVDPLVGRLLIYASQLMRHLTWRGARVQGGGTVPGWYAPDDFVADAFVKTLDGTRAWNRDSYPTLEIFLRSIIKSDIGHLARSTDNARGRSLSPPTEDEAGPSEVYAMVSTEPRPLEIIIDLADLTQYRLAVLKEIDGDPLLLGIFQSYEAEVIEPTEIAQRLGRSVTEINNAKKRLRRKLEKVDFELRPGGRHQRRTIHE